MKSKKNEGFTLVELLVSIAILSAIVIPTCTSLSLSYRMNAKTEQMMQAQLAVSSAVETLMARGITDDFVKAVRQTAQQDETQIVADAAGTEPERIEGTCDEFPGLKFILQDQGAYYAVTVMDDMETVSVDTSIRDLTTSEGGATQ